jgi:hypothetical protein
MHLEILSTSSSLAFPFGERQVKRCKGAAELSKCFWPNAMKLLDLSLAEFGELLKSQVASPDKCPTCWLGQFQRQVAFLLIVLLHNFPLFF